MAEHVSPQINGISASCVQQPEPIVRNEDKQSHAESLTDAALCAYIESAFHQTKSAASYNLPYLAEARKRFGKPGRRVPVHGQPSWTEWVAEQVGITDRHVRRLLAEYREKQLEESDPSKAEQQRLEAELKKAENEKKRAEATQKREAAKTLQSLLAAKAVELAEFVTKDDIKGAQNLAAAILDAAKNSDIASIVAPEQIPCSGCTELHSGIAAILTAEPQKCVDAVAKDCGVSTTVVRQAATRFNLLPVLSVQAEEVLNVA